MHQSQRRSNMSAEPRRSKRSGIDYPLLIKKRIVNFQISLLIPIDLQDLWCNTELPVVMFAQLMDYYDITFPLR